MQNFIQRVERRAVVKKKDSYIASFRIWSEVVPSEEMDAEMEEERKKLNPLGPGGLDPLEASARSERSGCQALLPRKHEVFETLPAEMQKLGFLGFS